MLPPSLVRVAPVEAAAGLLARVVPPRRRRLLAVVGLLVLLALLAGVATGTAPRRDYVTGLWPIALGSIAMLLAPVRARLLVCSCVALISGLAVLLASVPDALALGFAPIAVLVVWAASAVLARSDGARPELRTDADLRRYFAAALLAGGIAAAGAATTYLLVGTGDPARAALGFGAATAASHLYLAPLFLRLPAPGAMARTGERVVQWVAVVVVTPVLLLPDGSISLAFLVIPLLAWAALRATPAEAVTQVVGVLGLALTLTSLDRGPFADVPSRYGLPGDYRGVLLSAFAATCAVIVVPLVVRVGEYVGAAAASAAERDLVRGIVDGATGIAIIGTDPFGVITLFNPGAERLLGYRADEVLGKHASALHTPEAIRDKAAELGVDDGFRTVVEAVVGRRLVGTPIRFLRHDGVERTHAMTLSKLTVAGTTSGFVSTSEDITDQLDTEQALRDALETERRAVERLREVDAVKERFVSTVSHELRTPITSIVGYLEMLADGTLGVVPRHQVEALLRVQSNSHRLLALIDDLLVLSRVAEAGIRPHEEPFDLRDAVRTALDVVAPTGQPPRSLQLEVTLPEVPVPTYGDREMVERMIVNLVGNAVKFTDDGGSIAVTVGLDDGAHRSLLRVSDTGIGIPIEEQHQLFTRFFRSSLAESRAIPGSGLGLAIAQAVAEQHGGSIALTSRPGEGTTVEVHLPVRPGMSKIQLPLEQRPARDLAGPT
ncbi:PAS domain-containing sensor histidine kinase [Nocardioides rubriscoriae]|uniref:sensor histidine kinase n=1 Tax=Nocardioides rubriscoriae TaxID=642762 RepID=UPI0011DF0A0F|nr:PAS domain-containing sensor histidine kinase [Nocardioides rubriscoriae]